MVKKYVAIIIEKNNKFLIGKRSKSKQIHPSSTIFPSGKIEKNETPKEAIIREAKEELGITITNPLLTYKSTHNSQEKQEIYFFTCKEYKGNIKNKTGEFEKLFWISKDEIDKLTFDISRKALLKYVTSKNQKQSLKNKKLPLLNIVNKNIKTNTSKTILISVHHIIEINYRLMLYLTNKGFEPKNIFCLGKLYSTNKKTLEKYKNLEINISPDSLNFNPQLDFDTQFKIYIKEFINDIEKQVKNTDFKKLIIYDEGGELLEQINKLVYNKKSSFYKKEVIGIEHTSSGYNKLKGQKLNLPIINVARSYAKLKLETPHISKICIKKFNKPIKALNIKPKNILILGGGIIGQDLKRLLKSKYNISIYDKDKSLNEINNIYNEISNFDVIIGATGSQTLDLKLFSKIKKNSLVFSVSSSDREFPMLQIRQNRTNSQIHDTIYFKNIHTLNNGFPICFTGGPIIVPIKHIQLTVALVFYAILYANDYNKNKKGFVDLPLELQKELELKTKQQNIFVLD